MRRTSIFIDKDDEQAIQRAKDKTGLNKTAALIRLLIRTHPLSKEKKPK